jgi:nickel/cobalt transporter (NicO) family protein
VNLGPQLLLVGAVAAVGVLHTIVPDHWVPVTLIARQRGWSKGETARASFQAGVGHVLSTLLIAAVVWLAGMAVAERFGRAVDGASSLALVAFGGWIAVAVWRELHRGSHGDQHGHGHVDHRADFAADMHGADPERMATAHGELTLSIYEAGSPPRFRATGPGGDMLKVETRRGDRARQVFLFANHGSYWESTEEIPEPHHFDASITVGHGADACTFETRSHPSP